MHRRGHDEPDDGDGDGGPSAPPHPSSRRMTGKRSSGAATTNPTVSQNAGRRGARGVRPYPDLRIRFDRSEAARFEVVADGRDERPGEPGTTGRGGRGDARDDGRERGIGQGRVQVAGPLGAGIRGQRPELAIGGRDVVGQQHLRIAPDDPKPAAQQPELGRRAAGHRRAFGAARRERVVGKRVVVVGQERVERSDPATTAADRERVASQARRAARGRRGTDWPATPAVSVPAAPCAARSSRAGSPSSRDPRPPSSRTSGGRTRDRRTAAGARRSPRR